MAYTDEELAREIRHGIEANMGLRSIAKELGVTYGKVRHVDKKYNKPHREVKYTGSVVREIKGPVTLVWDLETTGLNTFMGQIIVASFLDMADESIETRTIFDYNGDEVQLLMWIISKMEEADILVGHNTLGFDLGMVRGRLAIHGLGHIVLPKRQQWDTYMIARYGFKGKPQGYSLENLLDFFRIPVAKDKPSKHDWAGSIILNEEAVERIARRCEADVLGNAYLMTALMPYYHAWKGR
jgi:DNA polymerase elongation subunit (family B)